jgi:Acyl-CoA synthetases (AMP-forming)/AMP-acid ligases II
MTLTVNIAVPRGIAFPRTPIHHNLCVTSQRYPERTAINFFGREITYQDFADVVEVIAGWLRHAAGVRPGDRVALYMQNCPQWLLAYYAILRADAIAVPLNPMYRAGEIRHYLLDSGARVIFCGYELLTQLRAASVDTHAVGVAYSDYLPAQSPYRVPDWIAEATLDTSGCTPWNAVVTWREPGTYCADPSKAKYDDICGIFYTSGSTGIPKGCVMTHRAFQHNIVGLSTWHWLAPGTNCLATAPMSHVSGLNHGVHIPVYLGGASVILPRWDAGLAMDLIENCNVGHASIAPTAIADMLNHPTSGDRSFPLLKRITAGGAPMPKGWAELLQQKLGATFIEAYGLTETAGTTHINPVTHPVPGSAGVSFFTTETLILDSTTLQPLPPGNAGEVAVCGPQLFSEYWNKPDETERAFITVGGKRYLRTGDIGYLDEAGYLFILDRAKRMINASGYKVWPSEVERILEQCPGVKEVCVVASPDPHRGETVKAYVVREPGSTLDAETFIAWAKERMAAYKYPRIVQFKDELPKSNVGKILWQQLQQENFPCTNLKTN